MRKTANSPNMTRLRLLSRTKRFTSSSSAALYPPRLRAAYSGSRHPSEAGRSVQITCRGVHSAGAGSAHGGGPSCTTTMTGRCLGPGLLGASNQAEDEEQHDCAD